MQSASKSFATLLCLALMGCAGSILNEEAASEQEENQQIGFADSDATLAAEDGGITDAAPSTDASALGDGQAPPQDTGAKSPPPDTTPTVADTAPPPSDTMPATPDAFVPNLGGPGDPCPCGGATLCFSGVCRPLCNAPTDPCKAVSNCPADHACVGMVNNVASVCLPAVAPGQACGQDAFCPVNHVCGSVNDSPYICLPICAGQGAACAGGGICLQTQSGCSFCSVPF